MPKGPYKQHLPDLNLSIEHLTEAVPDDGWWYVLQNGQVLAKFRSLKQAQVAWKQQLDKSGWKPPHSERDVAAQVLRENKERWARNRAG